MRLLRKVQMRRPVRIALGLVLILAMPLGVFAASDSATQIIEAKIEPYAKLAGELSDTTDSGESLRFPQEIKPGETATIYDAVRVKALANIAGAVYIQANGGLRSEDSQIPLQSLKFDLQSSLASLPDEFLSLTTEKQKIGGWSPTTSDEGYQLIIAYQIVVPESISLGVYSVKVCYLLELEPNCEKLREYYQKYSHTLKLEVVVN